MYANGAQGTTHKIPAKKKKKKKKKYFICNCKVLVLPCIPAPQSSVRQSLTSFYVQWETRAGNSASSKPRLLGPRWVKAPAHRGEAAFGSIQIAVKGAAERRQASPISHHPAAALPQRVFVGGQAVQATMMTIGGVGRRHTVRRRWHVKFMFYRNM